MQLTTDFENLRCLIASTLVDVIDDNGKDLTKLDTAQYAQGTVEVDGIDIPVWILKRYSRSSTVLVESNFPGKYIKSRVSNDRITIVREKPSKFGLDSAKPSTNTHKPQSNLILVTLQGVDYPAYLKRRSLNSSTVVLEDGRQLTVENSDIKNHPENPGGFPKWMQFLEKSITQKDLKPDRKVMVHLPDESIEPFEAYVIKAGGEQSRCCMPDGYTLFITKNEYLEHDDQSMASKIRMPAKRDPRQLIPMLVNYNGTKIPVRVLAVGKKTTTVILPNNKRGNVPNSYLEPDHESGIMNSRGNINREVLDPDLYRNIGVSMPYPGSSSTMISRALRDLRKFLEALDYKSEPQLYMRYMKEIRKLQKWKGQMVEDTEESEDI